MYKDYLIITALAVYFGSNKMFTKYIRLIVIFLWINDGDAIISKPDSNNRKQKLNTRVIFIIEKSQTPIIAMDHQTRPTKERNNQNDSNKTG